MDNRSILVGILLIFLAFNLHLREAALFKFTNFVCETINKSWINVTECRLHAVSRNVTHFNLNLTLLHPVKRDVLVEGQLFKRENGYKPWLYKASIDACRFVKKPYNPIAIIVYKMFKQYSNFNHSCPYEGIVLVQKLNLRLDTLPHAIPTGDYLLQLDWLISKRLQLITKAYFKFVEDL